MKPDWSRLVDEPGVSVNFPPVENGIDYLRDVVDRLARRDASPVAPRDLKYAVLHLQAATEVLLKYRLALEHWSLVVEKLDLAKTSKGKQITQERFDRGDFLSCSPGETVLRLQNIVGVSISAEEESAIRSLAKSRNALQHYGLTDTEGTIESRAAEVLDFLIRFLDEELLPELAEEQRDRVEDDLEYIRTGLARIRGFVKQRMERLQVELAPFEDRTLECPNCRQWALVAGGEEGTTCLFCHVTLDPKLTAWDYANNILHLPWRDAPRTHHLFSQPATPPIDPCPNCFEEALVAGVVTYSLKDQPTSFCFDCGVAFRDR
ncbi:hypothetical protein OG372_04090 [Streptomyces sp. NBC_01020]|uniref:hypothetical protein n=1 Tax=Streptomyces sp. NBC_01020 TaxID=2903722 RepID=UPI00386762CE|nr:hypothetical protein OG372_04090 [Streptomyces sp. NBC_01020]